MIYYLPFRKQQYPQKSWVDGKDSNYILWGLPSWLSGKESGCQYRRCRFNPWVGKIPWRRNRQHTPVFLPWTEEPGGPQSMGSQESDMTSWLNNSNNVLWGKSSWETESTQLTPTRILSLGIPVLLSRNWHNTPCTVVLSNHTGGAGHIPLVPLGSNV